MAMYESPIELLFTDIQHQILEQQDEQIYQAVMHFVPNVNREELLRALKYDRGQYDKGYADGVRDSEPKWIPVTERLPEVCDIYLVVVKSKYDCEKEYSIDTDVATYYPYEERDINDWYIDDCWNTYNDWNEGQQYLHVTHWMPLPEPPKGE
jgi:hypothetical protein